MMTIIPPAGCARPATTTCSAWRSSLMGSSDRLSALSHGSDSHDLASYDGTSQHHEHASGSGADEAPYHVDVTGSWREDDEYVDPCAETSKPALHTLEWVPLLEVQRGSEGGGQGEPRMHCLDVQRGSADASADALSSLGLV